MKEKNYIVWINNGVTSIAKILTTKSKQLGLSNPAMVLNYEYGETDDNIKTSIEDPRAVRVKYATNTAPYLLKNCTNDEFLTFTTNIDTLGLVTYLDEDAPLVKSYNGMLDSIKSV